METLLKPSTGVLIFILFFSTIASGLPARGATEAEPRDRRLVDHIVTEVMGRYLIRCDSDTKAQIEKDRRRKILCLRALLSAVTPTDGGEPDDHPTLLGKGSLEPWEDSLSYENSLSFFTKRTWIAALLVANGKAPQSSLGPRAIGGKLLAPDAYKEVVALTTSLEGAQDSLVCSGVAVERNRLFSASHCLCGSTLRYARVTNNIANPGGRSVHLPPVNVPANCNLFRDRNPAYKDHLSVITIAGNGFSPSDARWRRTVPSQTPQVGDYAYIVGYGTTELGTNNAGRRNLTVMEFASIGCRSGDGSRFSCDPWQAALVPFFYSNEKGTCFGDSGGGVYLIKRNETNFNRVTLVGVVYASYQKTANSPICGEATIVNLIN